MNTTSDEMSDQGKDIVAPPPSSTKPTASMLSINQEGESISQSDSEDIPPPGAQPGTDIQHAVTEPLESFERFVDLPIELRQMIWRFALPPRIVDLLLQSKERRVSRVRSDCAIGDGAPGSWDAFFHRKIYNEFFEELDLYYEEGEDEGEGEGSKYKGNKDKESEEAESNHTESGDDESSDDETDEDNDDEEEEEEEDKDDSNDEQLDGPEPLVYMKLTCPPLEGIFNACRESRDVMYVEGYTRTFCMLGSRATTLFSPRHDTLYVRVEVCELYVQNGERYFNELLFGPDPEGQKGWGLDRVENLAIGVAHVDGVDLELDWTNRISDWVVGACRNLKQLTLVMEYEVEGDYSDLVFADSRDFVVENSVRAQKLSDNEYYSILDDHNDAVELYEKVRTPTLQWLAKQIMIPLDPNSKLKELQIARGIVTTPSIKGTLGDIDCWYAASRHRVTVEITHWKARYFCAVVAHETTTVGQLGSLWLMEWGPNYTFTWQETIKISLNGIDLDLNARVLELEDIEEHNFELKIWDGLRWR